MRVYKVILARIPDNGKIISSFHWTDPAKEKDNKKRLRDIYTEFAVGGVVNFHNQELKPLLRKFVSPMRSADEMDYTWVTTKNSDSYLPGVYETHKKW